MVFVGYNDLIKFAKKTTGRWVMGQTHINYRERNIFRVFLYIALTVMFAGMSGKAVGDTLEGTDKTASKKPLIVYVSDFRLDFETTGNTEKGVLPVGKKVRGIVNQIGKTRDENPKEKAKKIVDSLADSIVNELNNKNINSRRIFSAPPSFSDCMLLEGEFVEYDEGGRIKRAIIGFGSGSPDMQVNFVLSEIKDGKTSVLLNTAADGKDNLMPGAAITKNPYVAGAKFVITKNAPERDVTSIGVKIADKTADYLDR